MDKSKIYQTEIPVSSNIGEITINSYTGRLLVNVANMSIGKGVKKVGLAHVYNDHMLDGFNMGHKWKLSFHQTVKQVGEQFVYLDSSGTTSVFDPSKRNGDEIIEWYENSGRGLTLVRTQENDVEVVNIFDNVDNSMRFENGNITKVQICTHFTNAKNHREYLTYNYSYENNLLKKVYISETLPHFEMEYNGDKVLSAINLVDGDGNICQSIEYTYQENKLVRIIQKVKDNEKVLFRAKYDGQNKIIRMVSGLYSQAVEIERDSSKVTRISTGYVKAPLATTHIGNDTYCGQNVFAEKPQDTSADEFIVDRSTQIEYLENTTVVSPSNSAKITYYMDVQGRTYKALVDGEEEQEKDTDTKIYINGESPIDVESITKVKFDGQEKDCVYYTEDIESNQDFVTLNDIHQTIRNMAISRYNVEDAPYDFIYCAGAKKISGVRALAYSNGEKDCQLDLTRNDNNERIPNLYTKRIRDGLTTTQYLVYNENKNTQADDYLKVYNITKAQYEEEGKDTVSTKVCSISDVLGDTLETVDEYGVKTLCEYDKYGNLTKRYRTSTKDNANEQIVEYEATYDDNGTLLSETNDRNIRTVYQRDSVYGKVMSSYEEGSHIYKVYVYDEFTLAPIEIQFVDRESKKVFYKKEIHYDSKGEVLYLKEGEVLDDNFVEESVRIQRFGYTENGEISLKKYNNEIIYRMIQAPFEDADTGNSTQVVFKEGKVHTTTTNNKGQLLSTVIEDADTSTQKPSETLSCKYKEDGEYSFEVNGEDKSFSTTDVTYTMQTGDTENSSLTIQTSEDGMSHQRRECKWLAYDLTDYGDMRIKKFSAYNGPTSIEQRISDSNAILSPINTGANIFVENMDDDTDVKSYNHVIETSRVYDNLGRMSASGVSCVAILSKPSYIFKYEYNGNQVTGVKKYVNNYTETPLKSTSIEYDRDKVTKIYEETCNTDSAKKIYDKTTSYNYDNYGRITSEEIRRYSSSEYAEDSSITPSYYSDINITYENGNIATTTDIHGNETSQKRIFKTFEYTKDVLTEMTVYNNNYPTTYFFEHDKYGYPTHYKQEVRGDDSNMQWDRGLLKTYNNVSYSYTPDGMLRHMRIARIDDDQEVYDLRYIFSDGSKVTGEYLQTKDYDYYEIIYHYDQSRPVGLTVYNRAATLELPIQHYIYEYDSEGNIQGIKGSAGINDATYSYNLFGECTELSKTLVERLNSLRWKGYFYDVETGLYYINGRWYDPETCRYISPTGHTAINLLSPNVLSRYAIEDGNQIGIINLNSNVGEKIKNTATTEWLKLLVGAIPDLKVGLDYLIAQGIKSSFAYATAKTYRFPILGGTHSAFTKGKYSYGDLVGASFRKITTDSARGGFGAFAKNFAKTSVYTLGVNFAFNLYENNWQIDDAMIQDTLIDTAIGVSSYYMAAGTMSLLTAGALVAFGWNVPGLIVVGGVVVLSIAYDALIRWITGYDE